MGTKPHAQTVVDSATLSSVRPDQHVFRPVMQKAVAPVRQLAQ